MTEHQYSVMDLADQIQRLGSSHRTGTLEVAGPSGRKKYIYFGQGKIEMVSIPRKRYLLGEALYKLGKIDRARLLTLINSSFKKEGVFGSMLLEDGAIEGQDLLDAMAFQLQEEVCDLFLWDSLNFIFRDGEPDPEIFPKDLLESKVSLSTEMLVIEAARRIDEWGRIKHTVPSFADVYRPVPGIDLAQLDEASSMVMQNMTGTVDVEDVLEVTRMDRYSTLQTIAYLTEQGCITPLNGNELVGVVKTAPPASRMRTRDILERAISLGTDDPDGYLRLAEIYEELDDKAGCAQTYLAYAAYAQAKGDTEQAQYGFRMAMDLEPLNPAAYEQASAMAEGARKPAEAAEILAQGGDRLFEAERFEDAKRLWEHAAAVDENCIPAMNGLGRHYEKIGEAAQANVEYGRAADLMLARDRKDEAIILYRHMLEVDRDCMDAGLNLARTLGEMGRTNEAVGEYKNLASSLSKAGVIADPIAWGFLTKVYESIIELDPVNSSAREWLANAYREKKNTAKASEHYVKLTELYLGIADFDAAAKSAGALIELAPDTVAHHFRLADVILARGKRDEALALLAAAAAGFTEKKKPEEARELYTRILEIDPFNLKARLGLAEQILSEGHKGQAGHLFYLAGKMCRGAERKPEAIACFESALAAVTEHIGCLRELSEIYTEDQAAGVKTERVIMFVDVLTRQKNFGEALRLAQILTDLNPGKIEFVSMIKIIEVEMQPPPASDAAAAEEDDPEAAIEALKHVASRAPDDISSREKLAGLYRRTDRKLDAATVYRELAGLYRASRREKDALRCDGEADALMTELGVKTKSKTGLQPAVKPASDRKPEAKPAAKSSARPAVRPATQGPGTPARQSKKKPAVPAKPAPVKPGAKPVASPAKPAVKSGPAPAVKPGSTALPKVGKLPMSLDDFEKGFK